MDSFKPRHYFLFRAVAVFNEDSCDIPAREDDDGMVIFDDFVVGLGADETCRDEVSELTVLKARNQA